MKINIQLFGGRGVSSGLYSFYLPKNPKKSKRFEDITHPKQRENSGKLTFKNKETGLEIEFHPKQIGKNGWKGIDHYHIKNPNSTGKNDYYLNRDGKPCPRGSKGSHLLPGEYKDLLRGNKKWKIC